MPTISVLMSVYNEPLEWIQGAIDSILYQTFSDFEFIIINDNPNRKELINLLSENAQKDKRIKIITNAANIGLTKSLNVGLKLCSGKYMARMDADDISMPTRFAKQVAFMDSHPEVIVCGTNIKLIGDYNPFYIKKIFANDIDIRGQMFYNSGFAHPSVFIRKALLDKTGIKYDETFRNAQDYKLWYDLRTYGKYANLKDKLLKYRLSKQQITQNSSSIQQDNRSKVSALFRNENDSKSIIYKSYIERNEAYQYHKPFLLIKSSFSRYTNISLKERLALFVRAIYEIIRFS